MWDFIGPGGLHGASSMSANRTGERVARAGTIRWVRSGIARVLWDDGRESEEWAADLIAGPPKEVD